MKSKNEVIPQNTASLRLEYSQAAAYYWFRASGPDEQLVSALNRMNASNIAARLGPHTPTDAEVAAYAIDRWPAHQRHA